VQQHFHHLAIGIPLPGFKNAIHLQHNEASSGDFGNRSIAKALGTPGTGVVALTALLADHACLLWMIPLTKVHNVSAVDDTADKGS
jgi:hypothetical protein